MFGFTTADFHIDNGTITEFTVSGRDKLIASGCTIDTFPEDVVAIGDYAFDHVGVTAIKDWGNITSIGQGAFLWNKITALPNSWGGVTVIGDDAFSNNNIVSIPHNWGLVKTIGDSAFWVNAIVSLPESCDNLGVVGDYAFAGNKISEKVSFESVESVGTLPLFDN